MQEAYIVKYSRSGTKLPGPQLATYNERNACYANATTIFAGSFTSFEEYEDVNINEKERKKLEDCKYELSAGSRIRSSSSHPPKAKVSFSATDILDQKVDAIVNAGNTYLNM